MVQALGLCGLGGCGDLSDENKGGLGYGITT